MTKRPNILYLFSDEHSFRYMGHRSEADGGEPVVTPNFDKLAAHGTVFSDAYCQMPLCTPSRLCQLTGKEARYAGAWNNEAVLRPELDTIPKQLARAGYATCLVGKMHLGGNQQFVGFQHRPYGDLTGKTGHQWEPITSDERKSMRARTQLVGVTGIPESLIQDEVVTHETVAWLREHQFAHPDQPWFLCASFSRPHFPLTAPRRWFEYYEKRGITPPPVPAGGDAYDHPMSVGMREGFQVDAIDEAEMMRARTAYFANVSYLDEVIGDLFLRLDADGLLDNTIIVYSTDHGEMAGEHGNWWKNGWFEACTHVPFIVSLPEQRRGELPSRVCETPVGLYDLFPTFAAFAEASSDIPDDLTGEDLSSVIRDGVQAPERPIICDNLVPRWGEGTEFRSLRWRNYKYVIFRNAPPLMFDLEADPGEQLNLLVHPLSDADATAKDYIVVFAEQSIDFDAAEQERLVRDGELHTLYHSDLPRASGNLYLMPDGRLVNVDDAMLYDAMVLSNDPHTAFGDYPEE